MAKSKKPKPQPVVVPLLVSTIERDEHNNPKWLLSFPNVVSRMDNSLAMQEVWGTLESDTKTASVCSAWGGFVIIVTVRDKKGKGSKDEPRRYAFNARTFLEHIINHDDELRKIPKLENRKRTK